MTYRLWVPNFGFDFTGSLADCRRRAFKWYDDSAWIIETLTATGWKIVDRADD